MSNNGTALIVGAAGFVGEYLSKALCAADYAVVATKMQHEMLALEQASIRSLDILDEEQIVTLLAEIRPSVIFHLAAQSSVALSWKKPGLTVDVNIKGVLNLLSAVRASALSPRIILVGSGEEYGRVSPEEIPVRETTLPRPGNIYAVTKNTQNQIGRLYFEAYGMDIVSTRSFNHIGPNQAPTFVVADFCKQVVEIEAGRKEPVLRVGNLAAKRDFTDVRDVVRAYVLLAQKGVAGETYNVGRGESMAIEDILNTILSLSPAHITVKIDPAKLRPVDVPEIRSCIEKLQSATGWAPEIQIKDTLRETLAHWRMRMAEEPVNV